MLSWMTDSRARSTKTRIETRLFQVPFRGTPYSRARSTKTRIETILEKKIQKNSNLIREQDPLKQGLKPASSQSTETRAYDSRARSTKTRIETCLVEFC